MTTEVIQLEHVNCGVCGSENYKPLFEAADYIYGNKGVWPVAQCERCGVVYMNPRIPPEQIGAYYPTNYYTNNKSGSKSWWGIKDGIGNMVLQRKYGYSCAEVGHSTPNLLAQLLYPLFSQWAGFSKYVTKVAGGRILDVGCGNGHTLSVYKGLGWHTFGNELGEDSARLAKQAGHEIFLGELRAAEYPNSFFDAVTMWDALEHIHDPLSTLCEIRRILKPDGRLYISVPNFGSWYARKFRDKWFMFTAPLHYYHYTDRTLTDLLHRAQLKDVQISYPLGDAGLRPTVHSASGGAALRQALAFTPVNLTLKALDYFMPKGHLLAVATK
jgi:SAM-dependent methyltransferase